MAARLTTSELQTTSTRALRASVLRSVVMLGIVALLPCVACAETSDSTTPPGESQLVVANPLHNFGTVTRGTKVEADFELRNVGERPITITGISTTCGCTAGAVGQARLDPGAQTTVHATFDTMGFIGPQSRSLMISTDNPKQAVVPVAFAGTVKPEVEVNPPALFFGEVSAGRSYEQQVRLVGTEQSPLNLQGVSSRSPALETLIADTGEAGAQSRTITVRLKESAPVGVLRSKVVVRTGSAPQSTIVIHVYAEVLGELRVLPREVSFGLLEAPLAQPVSRTVRLMNRSEYLLRVVEVKSTNPNITATVNVLTGGRDYQIEIHLRPGISGLIRGELHLSTDYPKTGQSEFIVPVSALVARKGG